MMEMKPCTLVLCISLLCAVLFWMVILHWFHLTVSYCSLTGAPVDFKQEITLIGRFKFIRPHLVQPVHLAAASGQVGIDKNLLNNGELAW